MAERFNMTFESNVGSTCVMSIFDADYTGPVTALRGVGRNPVIRTHDSSSGGVFAPIVAASLQVTYVNEGSVSVEEFVDADASRFTCTLVVDGITKFTGILSTDDLNERVIFSPSEVSLTFTDGLGLLKNFTIGDCDLSPLTGRYRIIDILTSLLKLSGQELPLNVFCNTYEAQMDNRSADPENDPFYQAGINIETFVSDSTNEDKWESVYSAIEKILSAWNCKLFQEDGKWQIVDVTEIASNPLGTAYDINGDAVDAISGLFVNQSDLVPIERSQIKSFERAAKRIVWTFNYRYPQLFRNATLQFLGAELGTITSGLNTITRYEAPFFTERNTQQAEIRVVRNTLTGREIDRYLYLYFNQDVPFGVYSEKIEVDVGDLFDFSFSIAADSDTNFAGEVGAIFFLQAYSGNKYVLIYVKLVNDNFKWLSAGSATVGDVAIGMVLEYPGSADLSQFAPFNFTSISAGVEMSKTFPEDGILYMVLTGWNTLRNRVAYKDALIKDIRFDYTKTVGNSIQLKGQEHTIVQPNSNREELTEIFIDDSPATSIRGTLFYMDGTSVPNRTVEWSNDETNFYRFGEIQLKNRMTIEGLTRYIVQGSFYGTTGMLNTQSFSFFPDRTFYPTRLIVNYAMNKIDATFSEIEGPAEAGANDYTFRFLYD